MNTGKLYITATPIGNLDDMTDRAKRVLKEVDLILCETPSETQNLLNHFNIDTKAEEYNQHTRQGKMVEIVDRLESGEEIALVSDAGTPAISDPGGKLVEYVEQRNKEIDIVPVPGSSAITTALSICGFPANEFVFLGFPPNKSGREKFFKQAVEHDKTVVFYESKHRIEKALRQLKEIMDANRNVCICRELTKQYESIYRGAIDNILNQDIKTKGEFTVVIDGKKINKQK
ncbi:MAG: 16S rRNA (cytidine(1402)-2'-O)-methyltransferase [Candidatus Paceibacteria bacterium]